MTREGSDRPTEGRLLVPRQWAESLLKLLGGGSHGDVECHVGPNKVGEWERCTRTHW